MTKKLERKEMILNPYYVAEFQKDARTARFYITLEEHQIRQGLIPKRGNGN